MGISSTTQSSRWAELDQGHGVQVCFVGRDSGASTTTDDGQQWLADRVPAGYGMAKARQCHSATVLEARAGWSGDGDALISHRRDLALSVVTADCVPVLLASERQIAAVHAGWRGLVKRIIAATADRFEDDIQDAWIGPAIGLCCYEVGEDVAQQVVAASTDSVAEERSPRPHVHLAAAAEWQLRQLGIRRVRNLAQCTYCESDGLWSYRRQGQAAGRNIAAIWRTPTGS